MTKKYRIFEGTITLRTAQHKAVLPDHISIYTLTGNNVIGKVLAVLARFELASPP